MPARPKPKSATAASGAFNVTIVAQNGRLEYEAVMFAASFRRFNPAFKGRLIVTEPQPGPRWSRDPRIGDTTRSLLEDELGVQIVPFTSHHFGESYPYGNKIEALAARPRTNLSSSSTPIP